MKILPLLVNGSPEEPNFHVVAPSLPGFGFSEAPKHLGFKLAQFAEVLFFQIAVYEVGRSLNYALGSQ